MPVVFGAIGWALTLGFAGAEGATAIAIGQIAVSLGTSLVLGGVAKLLIKKPPASLSAIQRGQGTQVNIRQPISSWRVIYGAINTGGAITYIETLPNGSVPDYFLEMVLTVAGHSVFAFRAMYFDGLPATDDAGTALPEYSTFIVYEKNLGNSGYPLLEIASAGLWTAAHQQTGRAGVHVELGSGAIKFPQGIPQITFDVEGKPVTDPRSSPAAPDYSNNPALCIRDYLTNTEFGLSARPEEIDDDSFALAANICDEDVELRDSGSPLQTEKRYTCNGSFETDQLPSDVIGALLSCCAGRLVHTNGSYKLYVGAYRTPNADVITEDDLRKTITVQTRQSKRDTANGVKGVFISAVNKWQPSDFPPYQSAAYLAEDGGEVSWKDVQYQFTTSIATAQRLAKIELERNRRQVAVVLPCKFSKYNVAPLDVIKLSLARFGWVEKTFEVLNVKLAFEEDENGAYAVGVDIAARETDAAVYAWDPDADETIVTPGGDVILPEPAILVSGPSNRTYRPLTNPLTATDAGSDATINVDDFTMRIVGLLDTPYDSGAITGLDYNTLYYVYFDDPGAEGGTVTYEASELKEDALGPGRFFIGSIRTPRAGEPDTVGNNDGGGSGAQAGMLEVMRPTQVINPTTKLPGGPVVIGNATVTDNDASGNAVVAIQKCFDGNPDTYTELELTGDGNGNSLAFYLAGFPGSANRFSSLDIHMRYEIVTNSLSGGDHTLNIFGVVVTKAGGSNAVLVNALYTAAVGSYSPVLAVDHTISPGAYGLQIIFQTDGLFSHPASGTLKIRIYEIALRGNT